MGFYAISHIYVWVFMHYTYLAKELVDGDIQGGEVMQRVWGYRLKDQVWHHGKDINMQVKGL
jgi:hypothetical protein